MAEQFRNIPLEQVMTAVSDGILRALEDRKSVLQDSRFDRIVITCGGMIALEMAQLQAKELPGQVTRQTQVGAGLD